MLTRRWEDSAHQISGQCIEFHDQETKIRVNRESSVNEGHPRDDTHPWGRKIMLVPEFNKRKMLYQCQDLRFNESYQTGFDLKYVYICTYQVALKKGCSVNDNQEIATHKHLIFLTIAIANNLFLLLTV